jgi:hypothetical protein
MSALHGSTVRSVSFSHDGKTVASGSGDKTLKLWDVATGTELRTLEGHDDPVRSVSFSSDSKTVASGSDDRTIKLWNIKEEGWALDTLIEHACGWVWGYLQNNKDAAPDKELCPQAPKEEAKVIVDDSKARSRYTPPDPRLPVVVQPGVGNGPSTSPSSTVNIHRTATTHDQKRRPSPPVNPRKRPSSLPATPEPPRSSQPWKIEK